DGKHLFGRVGGQDGGADGSQHFGPVPRAAGDFEHVAAGKDLPDVRLQRGQVGLTLGLVVDLLVLGRAPRVVVDEGLLAHDGRGWWAGRRPRYGAGTAFPTPRAPSAPTRKPGGGARAGLRAFENGETREAGGLLLHRERHRRLGGVPGQAEHAAVALRLHLDGELLQRLRQRRRLEVHARQVLRFVVLGAPLAGLPVDDELPGTRLGRERVERVRAGRHVGAADDEVLVRREAGGLVGAGAPDPAPGHELAEDRAASLRGLAVIDLDGGAADLGFGAGAGGELLALREG